MDISKISADVPFAHPDDADSDVFSKVGAMDYADPNCKICGGAGSLTIRDDHQKVQRYDTCRCVIIGRNKDAQDARIRAIFGEDGAKKTIAAYQTGGNPDNEMALKSAINYVNKFPAFREQGAGFALFGDTGCGKTHLATGTLIALIKRWNIEPWHLSVPEMLRLARKGFDDKAAVDVIDRAMSADVYLLDDIGSEYHRQNLAGMSWVDEQLFIILNHRLNHGLPTIYTTNLAPQELGERLDRRVARRLNTATVGTINMRTVPSAVKTNRELKNLLTGG